MVWCISRLQVILLGGASMDHLILLYEATCVDSKLGWYHAPPNSSAPACCMPESTVLCSECVRLCMKRDALLCRCALAQHQCVCEMPRRRAPKRSHDIIMSCKHISNIIMLLKTPTNIIITISDIIITQLHLTDIMHWLTHNILLTWHYYVVQAHIQHHYVVEDSNQHNHEYWRHKNNTIVLDRHNALTSPLRLVRLKASVQAVCCRHL